MLNHNTKRNGPALSSQCKACAHPNNATPNKGAGDGNLSREELELQHRKRDFIMIQKASIEQAVKKGIEQGIEQSRRTIIINAYQAGLPVDTIAQIVQLAVTDVEAVLTQVGRAARAL